MNKPNMSKIDYKYGIFAKINKPYGGPSSVYWTNTQIKDWCDKNDVELFILEEPVLPMEDMHIIWQRYFLFDIFDVKVNGKLSFVKVVSVCGLPTRFFKFT